MEGSDGAIREARRIVRRAIPSAYFYADQYNNPANWRAHYETTGVEIIEQTDGRLTHFVAGLGTSGTFVGTGRRLREWRASVRSISVQPDSPLHGLEGLKHMARRSCRASTIRRSPIEDLHVSTEDALVLTRRLAREAGLLVGPSSGAALAGVSRGRAHDSSAASSSRSSRTAAIAICRSAFWTRPLTTRPASGLADVEAAIRRHAVADVSGRVLRRAARLTAAAPCAKRCRSTTTATDERRRRFLVIGREDYQQAEARADALGVELLGFYHSHPDHPAVPSQFDLDHAWPNLSYVIVSVRARPGPRAAVVAAAAPIARDSTKRTVTQRSPTWQ